jgi:hypothetical protein
MKIKQLIDTPSGVSASFHVDEDGVLIVTMGEDLVEIPHTTALELIEYLRIKLYDHQEKNESFLKRLFR